MTELTGFSRDEIIDKKPPLPWWTDDNHKERLEWVNKTFDSDALKWERRNRKKNGELFWVSVSVKNLVIKGKKYQVTNWTDITERKKADEALKESEEFRSSLMEDTPNPIVALNPDTSVKYINPAMERLTGFSKEEVIGIKAPYPWWPAEKREEFLRYVPIAVSSGLFRQERLFQKKNGEYFWTELTSINTKGDSKLLITVWTDITERKRAEETLRDSEKRYRILAENISDVIYSVDIGTPDRLNYVNPSVKQLLGYTVEEAMNNSQEKVFSPDSYRLARRKLIETLAAESAGRISSGPFTLELNMIRKDGSLVPVEGKFSAVRGNDGKPLQILAILRDLTERKKAEEALKDSEEFNSNLLESLPNPVHVANPDTSIFYINAALVQQTGYSKDELIGVKIPYPWWPPDKLEEYSRFVNEDNYTSLKNLHKRELAFIRKSGDTFWVELTSTAIKYNKALKYRLSNWTEITERKRAEDALKHAAKEWTTTFDSISDAVALISRDMRLVRVNHAFTAMFKIKPEEAIGKHCWQIIHGVDLPLDGCPHKETLKTGKPTTKEFYEPHLGINIEASTSPIFDENGEVIGSVHVARDITERKKMQEHLMLTDRLASIGELASGIAHELNNPLTSVIGFSQLLMEKKLPPEIMADLSIVHEEAQRTASIVKNLLTFARKHTPVKQLMSIKNLVENVLELRAYEQKVNNIQIVKKFSDVPAIMADYFQIQQVFMNLIINAEYFMVTAHGKGTLTITIERVDNMVRIAFKDDGPGISEETRRHLFSPFFTTKPVGKGTGLGLSICHGIVTEHGGKIYVESEPGEGAAFYVELPEKVVE